MKNKPNKIQGLRPSEYLSSIDISTCRIGFCEKFDSDSELWDYSKHSHSCIEFLYFLEGRADISTALQDLSLSLFELIVYPQNVVHQEFLASNSRQTIICLHLYCEAQLNYDRFFKLKDNQGKLRWLFHTIHELYQEDEIQNAKLLRHLIQVLLDFMCKEADNSNEDNNLAHQCAEILQEEYSNNSLRLDEISAKFFVSSSYLSRMFKKEYRVSPMKYLKLYRLEIAKQLLIRSNQKISAIAVAVGFGDAKNFTKFFTKTLGISPNKFRANTP